MISNAAMPSPVYPKAVGPRYVLIPVHGYGIAVATVARMLDPAGTGTTARTLHPNEPIPYGAQPVLLAETTVYGAVCVEHMLRQWSAPRPWLVLVSDAPVRPAAAARFRFRALQGRVAGTAVVPYLPSLRAVEGADDAMKYKDVTTAAKKLRRQMEGKK